MKKTIYELLNDIEVDIDSYEKVDIDEIKMKKYKKNILNSIVNKKSKKSKNKIIVAIASLLIIFSFGQTKIGGKVYSEVVNKIKEITYPIYNVFNYRNLNEEVIYKYIDIVDMTVESNNIPIKISEVVGDGNTLLLSIIIDLNDKTSDLKDYNNPNYNRYWIELDYDLKVNGKNIGLKEVSQRDRRLNYNEGIYGIILQKDMDIEEIGNINIDFNINKIEINDSLNKGEPIKEYKGEWGFNFILNNDELVSKVNNIKLKEVVHYKDLDYSLDELRIGSLDIGISGKINNDILEEVSDKYYGEIVSKRPYLGFDGIVLKAKTNIGEEFLFGESRVDFKSGDIDFRYIDNDSMLNGIPRLKMDSYFEDIEYIELTPYYLNKTSINVLPSLEDIDNNINYDKGEIFKIYLNK